MVIFLQATLGGNSSPSKEDVTSILSSGALAELCGLLCYLFKGDVRRLPSLAKQVQAQLAGRAWQLGAPEATFSKDAMRMTESEGGGCCSLQLSLICPVNVLRQWCLLHCCICAALSSVVMPACCSHLSSWAYGVV